MSPNAKLLTGRVILTVVAIGTIVSPFLADWNATLIYNPLWPPHAKFHNAQTMVMGVLLGLVALFLLGVAVASYARTCSRPGCSRDYTGSASPSRSAFPVSPGPIRNCFRRAYAV